MKKKILYRALLGAPMGLAISYLITIAVSLGWGGGAYHPCMPGLVALAGSESGAVALQAAVACLVGAGFAGSSVVWEVERWGLALQTGVYFLLLALFMLPAAAASAGSTHSWPGGSPPRRKGERVDPHNKESHGEPCVLPWDFLRGVAAAQRGASGPCRLSRASR